MPQFQIPGSDSAGMVIEPFSVHADSADSARSDAEKQGITVTQVVEQRAPSSGPSAIRAWVSVFLILAGVLVGLFGLLDGGRNSDWPVFGVAGLLVALGIIQSNRGRRKDKSAGDVRADWRQREVRGVLAGAGFFILLVVALLLLAVVVGASIMSAG